MAARTPAPPNSAASSSSDWLRYFEGNAPEPMLPWRDGYRLSEIERASVVASIRQFQLGESGQGRRLLKQAEQLSIERGQPEYLKALRLFVKEEQRHSRILARFLELHGISCLGRHWVDNAFRGIRGLAGAELRMRVLATAEVLAMPYYSALRDATASPLLRAICQRILEEEAAHLQFQAFTFRLFAGARPAVFQRLAWIANRVLLAGVTALLWHEHGPVFHAAGYSWKRLHTEAAALVPRIAIAAYSSFAECHHRQRRQRHRYAVRSIVSGHGPRRYHPAVAQIRAAE
jgi:hypothetical protein